MYYKLAILNLFKTWLLKEALVVECAPYLLA